VLGDEELVGEPGDVPFGPRDPWSVPWSRPDLALVMGADVVHVVRRRRAGWRYVTTVLAGQRCSCPHHQVERPPTVP